MFKIEMIFIFTSSSDTLFHSLKGHSRSPARGWRLSSYLSRIAMRCWVLTESDEALIIYSLEQRILQTPSPPPTELVCNVLCVGTWLSSDIQRGSLSKNDWKSQFYRTCISQGILELSTKRSLALLITEAQNRLRGR